LAQADCEQQAEATTTRANRETLRAPKTLAVIDVASKNRLVNQTNFETAHPGRRRNPHDSPTIINLPHKLEDPTNLKPPNHE